MYFFSYSLENVIFLLFSFFSSRYFSSLLELLLSKPPLPSPIPPNPGPLGLSKISGNL